RDPAAGGVAAPQVESFFRIAFQLAACLDAEGATSIALRVLAAEARAPRPVQPGSGAAGLLRFAALWMLARSTSDAPWEALFDAFQKEPILLGALVGKTRYPRAAERLRSALEEFVDTVSLRTIERGQLGNWLDPEYKLDALLKALAGCDPQVAKEQG